MPSNIKADNQYFGKYFEIAITEKLKKNTNIPNPKDYDDTKDYEFTENEIKELNKQAEKIQKYIGEVSSAERIGEHTVLGTGDIVLNNNTTVEIKRVSAGSGTYHNTSVYYFDAFGFNFKDYMTKFKLRENIEKYFPDIKVSYKNNSPVNQADSSKIRHSNKVKEYEEILKIDSDMRMQFVNDLVNYFRTNLNKAQIFYKDMINKYKLSQQKETIVDRFIVYNYTKDLINEINLQNIKSNPIDNIYVNDFGFCISGLRVQIGWQNGNGLNNPTIRVFLK